VSSSQNFEGRKKNSKTNEKTKVLIQTSFSLFLSLLTFRLLNSFSLFLILSASAFSLLSLSFSFSLLPPSHFFLFLSLSLSLSLSLLLRVHHGFFAFLSFFSNIFFWSSSSFDRAIFKSQKIDYGDALYFFLSFLLFIFFCSSCFFCLQASTEDYKHMHVRFAVHNERFFLCGDLYVFYWDLSDSWLDLMFQVFKSLKWRVQPHPCVLNHKNRLWRCFIFFLSFLVFIFFCSSFFFCLQASTEDYKHMHMRFFVHLMFLLWRCFFFCFLKWTSMVLYVFYWDLSDSWLDLMFQVFKCLKWRV